MSETFCKITELSTDGFITNPYDLTSNFVQLPYISGQGGVTYNFPLINDSMTYDQLLFQNVPTTTNAVATVILPTPVNTKITYSPIIIALNVDYVTVFVHKIDNSLPTVSVSEAGTGEVTVSLWLAHMM